MNDAQVPLTLVEPSSEAESFIQKLTEQSRQESELRMREIEGSINEQTVSQSVHLKSVNDQIKAIDTLNNYLLSDVRGLFVNATKEDIEKWKNRGERRRARRRNHSQSDDDTSDESDEDSGGRGGAEGKGQNERKSRAKPKSNAQFEIEIGNDGLISIGRSSQLQPLLLQVEDIYAVQIRPPKSLHWTIKYINNILFGIGDNLSRNGLLRYSSFDNIMLLGHEPNMSEKQPLLSDKDIRDFECSRLNAPGEGLKKVGEYWSMVYADPAVLTYNAIKSTRGNNKATDQQIVDLVRSVSAHREFDKTVELFAKVMEVDGSSSDLAFLLYARHALGEVCNISVSESDGLQCVEYKEVIDFAAKLFNAERTTCRKAAERAIQLSHIGEILKSRHNRKPNEMSNTKQLEYFFETLWKDTRVRDDEEIKFSHNVSSRNLATSSANITSIGQVRRKSSFSNMKPGSNNRRRSNSDSSGEMLTRSDSLQGSRVSLAGGGASIARSGSTSLQGSRVSLAAAGGGGVGGLGEDEFVTPAEQREIMKQKAIENMKREIEQAKTGGEDVSSSKKKKKNKKRSDISKSPLMARRTLKLLNGGRRQSIMEIGGEGDLGSAGDRTPSTKDGRIAEHENDNNIGLETLGETEENEFEADDDFKKIEVKEEMWSHFAPVGTILKICDTLHKLSSERLKHAVWSTVYFHRFDKYAKGILSSSQFINLMADSKPKRTRDELQQLYSDLVFASEGGLMTYGAFRSTTLQLVEDGFLKIPDMTSDELLESAHNMGQDRTDEAW